MSAHQVRSPGSALLVVTNARVVDRVVGSFGDPLGIMTAWGMAKAAVIGVNDYVD